MQTLKLKALADLLDVPLADVQAMYRGTYGQRTKTAQPLGLRYKGPGPADPMAEGEPAADMPMDDLTALVRQLVQEALAEMKAAPPARKPTKAAPAGQALPTGLTTVKARRPFTSQFDAIATELLGLPDW